ncbi:hypothetical protein [Mycolicibacterium sp. HS_4_1]
MVVSNSKCREQAPGAGDIGCVTSDPVKDARQGRILLPVAATLIVVMMVVGWLFQGFSLVRVVLPDTSAAPADRTATQATSAAAGEQLYAWLAQLEAPLDALLVQRDNMVAASTQADEMGIQRACQSGAATLPRLQKLLPGPDAVLNTALQQVIDDYRFGFTYCVSGIVHHDAAAIEMAAVYLHRANNDLRTMMAIIARDLDASEPSDSDVVQI